MTITIHNGDCSDVMRRMIGEGVKVDCCVTSPPYWGLRDYGVEGQLGLEPTLGEHIEVMVNVFRLVRELLKDGGTLWLNYGDCYASTPNGRSAADVKAHGKDDRTFRDKPFSTIGPIYDATRPARTIGKAGSKHAENGVNPSGRIISGGYLKPKDLCMIPNRLAIALQEDGWWVRSEIIWHKPNPMPESTRDRPTSAHEKVWLLSKSPKYFYDAEAARQPDAQYAGLNELWDGMSREEQQSNGANLRNVWTIATAGFKEAHFATFPPELSERCINAGCRTGGTVLDPFGGAGTTGLVADRLGRNAILIELNPDYSAMAKGRITRDAPLFVDCTEAA